MHREISHADDLFGQTSNLGLYLLTALLAFLIGRDLAAPFMQWLVSLDIGFEARPLTRELYGFRFAMLAAVVGGARVLFHSLEALFEGRFVADLAIAIACIAAILLGEPLVAAEVVFIGMIGECLEAFTFQRAQRGIHKLVEVFPLRCWVIRSGEEVRVFTNQVAVGDRVAVKPGGKIPVDGVILEGRSTVDASPLTGESVPVERGPGEAVLAGCINQNGQLIVEAKKVSEETVAGRVIELTARALRDKAPIERQVDRLAKWFLPAVIAAAAVVFIINVIYQSGPFRPAELRLTFSAAARMSMYPTLSVLVVACPCALVLATPAAVIAALGRLAGTGVLIKGSSVLERLAKVQTFAFDKTGTLTEGKLELGDVIGLAGTTAEDVIQTAASVEQASEHPIGKLIVKEAAGRSLPLSKIGDFQANPGSGISASIETPDGDAGRLIRILVGAPRLLEQNGIAIPDEAAAALKRLDETGQTSLLVARAGHVMGLIGARDKVRPEAADVLQELRNGGITRIAMLSGDRAAVARSVAEQLKIDEVHADLLPADKAHLIEQMHSEEQAGEQSTASSVSKTLTAFVGDGINDAPALAKASVGIAVGSGTDVAAEAGDVIMMGEPLRHLPLLIRLSRESVRIIRQNILVYAFAVNAVGIVLTGILMPLFASSPDLYDKSPLVAVIYHQAGSLLVLLNSMRLLAFERAADRSLSRWKNRYRDFDRWMERNLTLDQIAHAISHRWKPIVITLVFIAFTVWLLSGFVIVEPDEAAVAQRFGRIDADLGPGLHYRLPWPIDSIRKVKPDEVKVVVIDFAPRTEEDDDVDASTGLEDTGMMWTSAHGEQNRPKEAAMLTGDNQLVEVLASVHFTIDNPRQYLFTARRPKAVIRSAAEGALREVVAGRAFLDLLTVSRTEFQEEVTGRLQRQLSRIAPEGLGVRIADVTVHDLHPPQEVVPAYYEVAKAMQDRDQQINRAHAQTTRTKKGAEEDALRMVNEAMISANGKINQAKSSRDHFLAWHRARTALRWEEEARLLDGFARALARGENIGREFVDYATRREKMLETRRFLTDFRLSWDALTGVLKSRDKIIIDADRLPGRRHLFLMDPDLIRPQLLSPAVGKHEGP